MHYTCKPEDAPKIWGWLKTRGGIAVWESVNLSNPDASWATPALQEDGTPMKKPTWEAGSRPIVISNVDQVLVSIDKEVLRFHIGITRSGTKFNVSDAGTRRIRTEVANAGKGAYYTFDYVSQEAVIWAQMEVIPIVEYMKGRAA